MITGILSFFGGSAFRMIWGEISHWLTSHTQHKQEIERMRLDAELAERAHQRQQAAIKLQSEMGVKVVEAQAIAAVEAIDAKAEAHDREVAADAWYSGVLATTKTVGLKFIDGWNAAIRPAVATWAVLMLTLESFGAVALSVFVLDVCAAALGLFLADRTLAKRGK